MRGGRPCPRASAGARVPRSRCGAQRARPVLRPRSQCQCRGRRSGTHHTSKFLRRHSFSKLRLNRGYCILKLRCSKRQQQKSWTVHAGTTRAWWPSRMRASGEKRGFYGAPSCASRCTSRERVQSHDLIAVFGVRKGQAWLEGWAEEVPCARTMPCWPACSWGICTHLVGSVCQPHQLGMPCSAREAARPVS